GSGLRFPHFFNGLASMQTEVIGQRADEVGTERSTRTFQGPASISATAGRTAEATHQSALIPAALMILPHFCASRFHNAARSCGEPDLCLAPNLARLASISGDCSTRLVN